MSTVKLRLFEYPGIAKHSSVTLDQLNYSLVEIAHYRECIALEINEPTDALKYLHTFQQHHDQGETQAPS